MSDREAVTGRVTRISGPIVYAEGLGACGLYDVVDVGEAGLIGEIIRLKGSTRDGSGLRG